MPHPVALRPLGSLCAVTGRLTTVLLDSGLLAAWEPALDAPTDDDLGGHPQRVLELLDDDAFVAGPMKVGRGKALVLDLEGTTGEAEIYALPSGTIALVEPTLSWWLDNFPAKAAEIQALFTDAFDTRRRAEKVGTVAISSGKLALFDGNANLAPARKLRSKRLANGGLAPFGRDGDGALLALRAGPRTVRRRVLAPGWTKKCRLVVACLESAPTQLRKTDHDVVLTVHMPKAKARPKPGPRSTSAPAPAAAPKTRSSVVFVPSLELAAIVGGAAPLTLREVHDRVDAYIAEHGLKGPKSFFTIHPDARLGRVLGAKPVSIYEKPGLVRKHLTRKR